MIYPAPTMLEAIERNRAQKTEKRFQLTIGSAREELAQSFTKHLKRKWQKRPGEFPRLRITNEGLHRISKRNVHCTLNEQQLQIIQVLRINHKPLPGKQLATKTGCVSGGMLRQHILSLKTKAKEELDLPEPLIFSSKSGYTLNPKVQFED